MDKRKALLIYMVLLAGVTSFAQGVKNNIEPKGVQAEKKFLSTNSEKSAGNRVTSNFHEFAKKCSGNIVSQRLFEEYGAVFSANLAKVFLPGGCFFRNEAEVQQFQRRAGFSSEQIDGIEVRLQPQALKAFLAARAEAQKSGFEITPRGTDSSRRSYNDTLKLWLSRVDAGLNYWLRISKLTKQEGARIRLLPIDKQVLEILKLEEKRIYFGNGFGKSILQSVAAPGASQHNLMLALDIEQHADSKVRAILAKYGWFQTVKNDIPHFTYLGVKESKLSIIGLKRVAVAGRTVWITATEFSDANFSVKKSDDEDASKPKLLKTQRPRVVGKSDDGEEKDKENNSFVKLTTLTIPTRNIPATASRDVILRISMESRLSLLTQRYYLRTGKRLHITSGYRSPERQARAMHFNLVSYGIGYVAGTYGGRAEVWEIIKVFRENREDEQKAILAMTKVIQSQVKRGKVISIHIGAKAFDIRSRGAEAANFSVLRDVVRGMGGEVVVEKDHYHVEFK
jgi:hypothetical protein